MKFLHIIFAYIACCITVCGGAIDVRVGILPSPNIQVGHPATLVCEYELHGAPLYSVKWYKGHREFYRVVPNEKIETQKIFPFPGLNIDLSQSDERKVTIRNISFKLAGNYSCEVSADAPSYSTAFVSTTLTVIKLPRRRPSLVVEMPDYEVGDILRANCSSGPSRPAPKLSFYINNVPVFDEETFSYPVRTDTDGFESTTIGLLVKLRTRHIDPTAKGPALHVRCDARILSIYADSARLSLDLKPHLITSAHTTQPKHERGKRKLTASGSSRNINITTLSLVLFLNHIALIIVS